MNCLSQETTHDRSSLSQYTTFKVERRKLTAHNREGRHIVPVLVFRRCSKYARFYKTTDIITFII